MAIIKGSDYVPVFTDIKLALLNGFAQVGSTWYFGYVNMSGNAVVYSSTDAGVTWNLAYSYPGQDYVNISASQDGRLVCTVSSVGYAQTTVYADGAQVFQLPSATTDGAVCFWPVLFLGLFNGRANGFYSGSGAVMHDGFGGTETAGLPPIHAVLGYGSDPGSFILETSSESEPGLGWSGSMAVVYGNFNIGLSNPSDPHSALALKYGALSFPWIGLESSTWSGFLSIPGGGGVSSAGSGNGFDFSAAATRGLFYDGYPSTSDAVIADRGLVGPHQTAFACLVDGVQVAFFRDRNGLMGSTVNQGISQSSVDSSGSVSPFSGARIYGNSPTETFGNLCYGAPNQSTSLSVFQLTNNSGSGVAQSLYRLTDHDVLTRPHAANTSLYSTVVTVRYGAESNVDPFAVTTGSNALGPARLTGVPAKYGTDLLVQACTTSGVLPNPNHSPGCSPVLRELMVQSGVPFSVARELANDGDPNGHQGGNAIDLCGPSSSDVLSGVSVTDESGQEMAEICSFLRAVPSLFATVIHYDPVTPGNGLFIWDGQLTTVDHFGGATAQVVQDSITNIHVSSSNSRLLAALTTPIVAAALGTGPAYTDPTTSSTTSVTLPDLFSSDRYVYVNDDGYIGSATQGLAVKKDPAQIINFW